MKKEPRIPLLKVQRVYEVAQNDKISFGFIAFIDRERSEVFRLIFWLFSQKETNKYRFDNYLGRAYESLVKSLGINEVEACELLLKKLELAKSLGFGTVINEAIEERLKLMKKKLRIEKYRAKIKEGLKHG